MKKIVRLTESDLVKLVKRVIMEQEMGGAQTCETKYVTPYVLNMQDGQKFAMDTCMTAAQKLTTVKVGDLVNNKDFQACQALLQPNRAQIYFACKKNPTDFL